MRSGAARRGDSNRRSRKQQYLHTVCLILKRGEERGCAGGRRYLDVEAPLIATFLSHMLQPCVRLRTHADTSTIKPVPTVLNVNVGAWLSRKMSTACFSQVHSRSCRTASLM